MFFNQHPIITVTNEEGKTVQVTDIFSTIKYLEQYKNTQYSTPYFIREGDTPESIAKSVYDRQSLSWVIMLVNGMKNPYTDWALSSFQFDMMMKKYSGLVSLFLTLGSINDYALKSNKIIIRTGHSNVSAEIVDWNPSLSKLTIRPISGTFATGNTISYSGSSTVLGTIGRVVLYEMDALHHFEVDGVYVDPLLGYLQGYIGGGSNNVVTNSEYETKLNDNKRLIYIPTISVARRIESEYSTLMTQ